MLVIGLRSPTLLFSVSVNKCEGMPFDGLGQTRDASAHKAKETTSLGLEGCRLSYLVFVYHHNEGTMSPWSPGNIPFRLRASQASPPLHTAVSCLSRAGEPPKPTMESGPGPPAIGVSEPQIPQMPELPQDPVPQQLQLPLLPSLAPLRPTAQPVIQGFQAINAVEVIDLTGLGVDEDDHEDDGDGDGDGDGEWEDVPQVIDLTNLPSDSDDDGDGDAEAQDGPVQNYTLLNPPSRSRYALIDRPPIAAPTHPRRRLRATAAILPRVARRAAARAPLRRDVCELCARVVRWGPGCLITKHHLYPQEITKRYSDRYTPTQKNSLALLCRPCHDACHSAHDNRTLADFYYEVDLLKADPAIQAHIRSMQRATTPELRRLHGDGVSVLRGRKYLKRLARAAARAEMDRGAAGRPNLTETGLTALTAPDRPVIRPSARLTGGTLRAREPAPLPGPRRSARLLARSTGDQHQVPVIVIDDEDEVMQDAATRGNITGKEKDEVHDAAIHHENPTGEKNEEVQDQVSLEDLLDLAARGEYIPL